MTAIRFVRWCIRLAWGAQLVLAALLLARYGLIVMWQGIVERVTRRAVELV
jgi:hypothetical protein